MNIDAAQARKILRHDRNTLGASCVMSAAARKTTSTPSRCRTRRSRCAATCPSASPACSPAGRSDGLYQRIREHAKGRPTFVLHDGPPYANGADPHRPRGQQDPQGHGGQVAPDRRLRRALRAGLGLPRPADRTGGREEIRQGRRQARRRRLPAEVPRVRRRADRRAEPRLPAPGRDRRLGASVPHHGLRLRGGHAAFAGEDRRARPPVARRQAGALVLRLRFGAGRSRDRIRRQDLARGRRGLRRASIAKAARPRSSASTPAMRSSASRSGPPRRGPCRPAWR